MVPQNKLVLVSGLCLLVLAMSVNGAVAEPKHVGNSCSMAPSKCPDYPGACSLNPGLKCPHPEYLRRHANVDGHGVEDAQLYSFNQRLHEDVYFNTVVQGETDYFLNADGRCTNLDFMPLYRSVLPPLDKEDTIRLGNQCTVDHDPKNGHLLKETVYCKEFAKKKPVTAREQYERLLHLRGGHVFEPEDE